jgi:O-antigen ligase/tetratricopeptide (TPR) repeat protein
VTPGVTISLYPEATRTQLLRLLAVFLLFAAVRNNVPARGGLRRLGVVCLINGAALSFFALVQSFSSPANVLYWNYPSLGQVFGPFICRNHFAFYVNLCIGLGVGLLLSRTPQPGLGILRDPAAMWACTGLALMAGAVVFSLSRGGMLALGCGALTCLWLARWTRKRSSWGWAPWLVVPLALLLAGWLGKGLIQERLATLWSGEAFDSRLSLWARAAPLASDFPHWGTGYGTFMYTEVLHQNSVVDAGSVAEHAHNEYLEVLCEAGVPGLTLGLLAVALVYQLGFRAIRQDMSQVERGLPLGALFGFSTLVVQSVGDFGLHIPAVALLATVVAAHLCGSKSGSEEYCVRLGGLAPLAGAAACLGMALVFCAAGWRAHRVDRLQLAADLASSEGPNGLEKRVLYLEWAAQIAPENALLHVELGRARLALLTSGTGRLGRTSLAAWVAEAALAARGNWETALGWSLAGAVEQNRAQAWQAALAREHFPRALRHYREARNRCPLLAEPHLVLATHTARLAAGDSRDAYLDRVKLLSSGDPEAWYLCGLQELEIREPERAWSSWRRCLELSDHYLAPILESSTGELAVPEIAEKVLPDRPELLLAASVRLFPEAGKAAERRPFLNKALRVLANRSGDLTTEEWHIKAVAHSTLGQFDEAVAAYRHLLAREPGQAVWRCELAQVLHDRGWLQDARREVVLTLAQQPGHAPARELMALISHELARKR